MGQTQVIGFRVKVVRGQAPKPPTLTNKTDGNGWEQILAMIRGLETTRHEGL